MQDMRLLILNQQGIPTDHGIIRQQITAEKYLCQFTRIPASWRVCDLTEIQSWHLFDTDEAMNAFILAVQPPPSAAPKPTKKPAKKKVVKKTKTTPAQKRAAQKAEKTS